MADDITAIKRIANVLETLEPSEATRVLKFVAERRGLTVTEDPTVEKEAHAGSGFVPATRVVNG